MESGMRRGGRGEEVAQQNSRDCIRSQRVQCFAPSSVALSQTRPPLACPARSSKLARPRSLVLALPTHVLHNHMPPLRPHHRVANLSPSPQHVRRPREHPSNRSHDLLEPRHRNHVAVHVHAPQLVQDRVPQHVRLEAVVHVRVEDVVAEELDGERERWKEGVEG